LLGEKGTKSGEGKREGSKEASERKERGRGCGQKRKGMGGGSCLTELIPKVAPKKRGIT